MTDSSKAHAKILIVKIGAIGDVVMALPLLQQLRKTYPEAHISWLCGTQVAPLLEATQGVDRILPVEERALLTGSFWQKSIHLLKAWLAIGWGRRFDLVLTLHGDPRYRLLSRGCRGSDRRHSGRDNQKRPHLIPGRYHAQEYLRLLSVNPVGPIQHTLTFPKLRLPELPLSIREGRKRVIVMPGGAKNTLADDALRRWPITSYVALITRLVACADLEVVVAGSESDRWVAPFLPEGCHQTIGHFTLLQTIALLQSATLLITHDSGPLHLAKLVSCPVLALFGPTNPQEKTAPDERIIVLWGGASLACRPCYDGKHYAPCKENLCLSTLSPECVFRKARELMP